MLKVYNLTISKHAIFLFHTFLCWKRCIFFFSFWFICLWFGDSFVYFDLCLRLPWAFFLVLLFLFFQGLFQNFYKLCCHQGKILTFCCPLNLQNKRLNLLLSFCAMKFLFD